MQSHCLIALMQAKAKIAVFLLSLSHSLKPFIYQNMTVRTRFAPSPTGYLHVGGARTERAGRALGLGAGLAVGGARRGALGREHRDAHVGGCGVGRRF